MGTAKVKSYLRDSLSYKIFWTGGVSKTWFAKIIIYIIFILFLISNCESLNETLLKMV